MGRKVFYARDDLELDDLVEDVSDEICDHTLPIRVTIESGLDTTEVPADEDEDDDEYEANDADG